MVGSILWFSLSITVHGRWYWPPRIPIWIHLCTPDIIARVGAICSFRKHISQSEALNGPCRGFSILACFWVSSHLSSEISPLQQQANSKSCHWDLKNAHWKPTIYTLTTMKKTMRREAPLRLYNCHSRERKQEAQRPSMERPHTLKEVSRHGQSSSVLSAVPPHRLVYTIHPGCSKPTCRKIFCRMSPLRLWDGFLASTLLWHGSLGYRLAQPLMLWVRPSCW